MKLVQKLGAATAVLTVLGAVPAFAEYPERPVTIIVPWGAGGGTDTIIRIFAVGFEAAMGQPVNVVNRTGGSGVVGHSAIANARADGYTLGACTSEITYFETVGLAPITPANFDLISRLAVIPAGVTVKADSPYDSVEEVIAAASGDGLVDLPVGTELRAGETVSFLPYIGHVAGQRGQMPPRQPKS